MALPPSFFTGLWTMASQLNPVSLIREPFGWRSILPLTVRRMGSEAEAVAKATREYNNRAITAITRNDTKDTRNRLAAMFRIVCRPTPWHVSCRFIRRHSGQQASPAYDFLGPGTYVYAYVYVYVYICGI